MSWSTHEIKKKIEYLGPSVRWLSSSKQVNAYGLDEYDDIRKKLSDGPNRCFYGKMNVEIVYIGRYILTT